MDKFLEELGFEEVSKEYADQHACEEDTASLADIIEDALCREEMIKNGNLDPDD